MWRRYISNGGNWDLHDARETVHVSDDARRICMVETQTWEDENELTSPTPRLRFQLDDHLGTVAVEVDATGNVISYEQYHPYGTSAYRAQNGTLGVSAKRYRYNGKERDDETKLYYYGARYYAPWLGRWTAADPLAFADGVGAYTYVRGSPVVLSDPNGKQGKPRGLTVSRESRISAKQLYDMIQNSPHLDQWMKDVFTLEGNTLHAKEKFSVPLDDQGKPIEIPEWFQLATHAIRSGNFHFTTAAATADQKFSNIMPDWENNDRMGAWMHDREMGPVVSEIGGRQEGSLAHRGMTVPKEGWYPRDLSMLEARAQGTAADPTLRQIQRGLIVVANRLVPNEQSPESEAVEITDPEALLDTFFHETSAHGGLMLTGDVNEARHREDDTKPLTKADTISAEVHAVFGYPKVTNPFVSMLDDAKRLEARLKETRQKESGGPSMRPLSETKLKLRVESLKWAVIRLRAEVNVANLRHLQE